MRRTGNGPVGRIEERRGWGETSWRGSLSLGIRIAVGGFQSLVLPLPRRLTHVSTVVCKLSYTREII